MRLRRMADRRVRPTGRNVSILALLLAATPFIARAADPALTFTDVSKEAGLESHLRGALHHGVAWGDVDGDGKLDLFLGNFDKGPDPKYGLTESIRNGLFRQVEGGRFELLPLAAIAVPGRCSGAALVDLDNDGDVDLIVTNNNHPGRAGEKAPPSRTQPTLLYRNDGGGRMTDVSGEAGFDLKTTFFVRDVGVFDYDNDGLLDLLLLEDKIFQKTGHSKLLRNEGGLKFKDVTKDAGLPTDLPGFGLAVTDLNADGRPDFFVAGDNRLFLSKGTSGYEESLSPLFREKPLDAEDWVAGAAFGDLDLDGDMDLITGVHFAQAHVKVYLNDTKPGGPVSFRDVTKDLGIPVLPNKAPTCQIADFDRDGFPDVYWSCWFTDAAKRTPFIARGLGVKDGLPRFDVPSTDGLNTSGVRKNVAPEQGRGVVYYVNGPAVDYDADGDLDFFAGIWPDEMSHLFRNDSPPKGNWLSVKVEATSANRAGIGAKVRVLADGRLVGHGDVTINGGYSGTRAPVAYFGLGDRAAVDVEVLLPGGITPIKVSGVKANQVLVVRE